MIQPTIDACGVTGEGLFGRGEHDSGVVKVVGLGSLGKREEGECCVDESVCTTQIKTQDILISIENRFIDQHRRLSIVIDSQSHYQ